MYKKLIDCVNIGERSEAAKLLFQLIHVLEVSKTTFPESIVKDLYHSRKKSEAK